MFDINQLQQMMMQAAQSGGLQALAPGAGQRAPVADIFPRQQAAAPVATGMGMGGVPQATGGMVAPGGAAPGGMPNLDALGLAKRAARRRMEQQALAGAGQRRQAQPAALPSPGVPDAFPQRQRSQGGGMGGGGGNPWAALMQQGGGGGRQRAQPSMTPPNGGQRQRNRNPLGGPSF